MSPRRILVVGSSGAGKSTLAREIGARLGLPVVHLDRHFWRPGWVEPTPEAWSAALDALLAGEAWVMDGNFGSSMARRLASADLAVFLDRSRWLCAWRVVGRWRRYYGRARPDLAEGCPERVDLGFLHYVLAFPHVHRPRVVRRLAEAEAAGVRVVRLRSDREVAAFLAEIGADGAPSE